MLARTLSHAEQRLLTLLQGRLQNMRMLDIGVGGGRTSVHFAPKCQTYIGTDYSSAMIAACEKEFAEHSGWKFRCCDARSMGEFADAAFDFVLFSYNGIDYVSHRDRLQILREVHRVCAPGGVFAFSTHNLDFAADNFAYRRKGGWKQLPKELARFVLIRLVNLRFLLHPPSDYARINDGTYRFGLTTYYVRPEFQIQQLYAEGFVNVRSCSGQTDECAFREPAPYFICDRPAS